MSNNTELSKMASDLGKRGARKLRELYGDKHYAKFSKAGVEARRAKRLEREKLLGKTDVDNGGKVA